MTEPAVCLTWNDHRWSEPRFLEAGRHPTMGNYHRYVTTCEFCKRTTTETRWFELSQSAYGYTVGNAPVPRG